ncbi:MAG: hypothetical protein WC423_05405 [Vulcanimicrobiota bacterium]
MIEQILTTQVGMIGFAGFVAVALVGFFIVYWIRKELRETDEK